MLTIWVLPPALLAATTVAGVIYAVLNLVR